MSKGTQGSGADDDRVDDDEVGTEESGSEDLLPPPISADSDPKPWFVTAGAATAVLCVAWIAGARALAPLGDAGDGAAVALELGFSARLAGMARALVFLPLATAGLLFGVLSLAFVRQRPIGDVPALIGKCAAITALAMLVRLAPIDTRFVKATLDFVGPAIVAAVLLVPLFRLHPRDAVTATGFALLGLVLLTLFAFVIVWATAL
jgi:hypothetical protein